MEDRQDYLIVIWCKHAATGKNRRCYFADWVWQDKEGNERRIYAEECDQHLDGSPVRPEERALALSPQVEAAHRFPAEEAEAVADLLNDAMMPLPKPAFAVPEEEELSRRWCRQQG
jgi:hypothetical protein